MPSIYFSSGHIQYGHTCSLAHKGTSARFLLFWRESEKSVEEYFLYTKKAKVRIFVESPCVGPVLLQE